VDITLAFPSFVVERRVSALCRVRVGSYLGEDGSPDGLNVDVGSLDQGLELVGLEGHLC
jgi:hypothetical protein